MPRGRQPQGEHALSNAERQARYRARHEGDTPAPVVRYAGPSTGAPAPTVERRGRRAARCASRMRRMVGGDARGSARHATAEALRAIVELDLDASLPSYRPRIWT